VIIFAVIAVALGEWSKARRRRREAETHPHTVGYLPAQSQNINPGAVVFSIIPLAGILLLYFVISGFILKHYRNDLPEKFITNAWIIFFFVDAFALSICMHFTMPKPYLIYIKNKPKHARHTSLDWMVGVLMTVIFIPSLIMHLMFIFNLQAS